MSSRGSYWHEREREINGVIYCNPRFGRLFSPLFHASEDGSGCGREGKERGTPTTRRCVYNKRRRVGGRGNSNIHFVDVTVNEPHKTDTLWEFRAEPIYRFLRDRERIQSTVAGPREHMALIRERRTPFQYTTQLRCLPHSSRPYPRSVSLQILRILLAFCLIVPWSLAQPTYTDTPSPTHEKYTARDVLDSTQMTLEEESFYVCPAPTGSTLIKMEAPRKCPEERTARKWQEGIMVIFKENIEPYKFKVTTYYKNVIQTTTWSGTSYIQITSRTSDRVPVDFPEIFELIDGRGKCSTKASYLRNNLRVEAFDRDERARDADLVRSRFSTPESPAWHTTNDTYTAVGSPWVYRTGTSVNCIVEDMDARSAFPYDYFGMANGEIANISPFYTLDDQTGASAENNAYAPERFQQKSDYRPIDLNTKEKSNEARKRNFLKTPHYTVAWDWKPKKERVCSMALWKTVDSALAAIFPGDKMRFMAETLSATFISNVTQFDPDRILLGQCVRREAEREIDRIFKERYNGTHVKSGHVQYHLALGGFMIGFQPILSNTLAKMYIQELINDNRTDESLNILASRSQRSLLTENSNHSSLSRLRRAVVSAATPVDPTVIRSTTTVQFAMLQFVYDNIQQHMNEMFSRLAAAWCELQNRETVLWREVGKINPAAVVSANMGRRVSARVLGDVFSVSSCLTIDASTVTLQNSMRSITAPNTCYSRPLVLFSYEIGGPKVEGQLGESNEILQTTELLEPCTANHRRVFLFGSTYALFEGYSFVRMIEPSDLQTISTFVELNITLLEDREILPLTVYTKEELRDVGVLDYTEVSRRNQMHSLKFYDIDKVIEIDTNHALLQGLADVFSGLGQAGKAIGKVIVGAAGAVVSTVAGVASFISNPFGALAVGLLVIAAIVAAFLAYRYINKLKSNPMKTLYPMTTKALLEDGETVAGDAEHGVDSDEIDEEKLQQAREMVKYLTMLSASERQEKKLSKKKNGTSARLAKRLDDMRLRAVGNRNGGREKAGNYERLVEEEDEFIF
nr:envelope glycoprotein B UL2 [Psittacid alphaherpesvirus 6]